MIYIGKNANSIECKSAIIYSVSKIARSELDGLRFNIGRLIVGNGSIRETIQKNSLLLNADDTSISIISQVRIANSNGILDLKSVEMEFAKNLNEISKVYGFAVLNKSVECLAPPLWYQFLLPIALFFMIILLIIKRRIDGI